VVALANPYALPAGAAVPIRLTYQGQALAGALVVAVNSLDPQAKQTVRSDSDGRVSFRLEPGGLWLIKAVHMVIVPAGSVGSVTADWVSHWASLTFGVHGIDDREI
jgi:uncharacterized GH25 family protein